MPASIHDNWDKLCDRWRGRKCDDGSPITTVGDDENVKNSCLMSITVHVCVLMGCFLMPGLVLPLGSDV